MKVCRVCKVKLTSENWKSWEQRDHHHICSPCRITKVRDFKRQARKRVLDHYGPMCNCCGESNVTFLTIDHVNGGGTKDTRHSQDLCCWIVKNNFPSDFQILCYNCNCGRQLNGGICPHISDSPDSESPMEGNQRVTALRTE